MQDRIVMSGALPGEYHKAVVVCSVADGRAFGLASCFMETFAGCRQLSDSERNGAKPLWENIPTFASVIDYRE